MSLQAQIQALQQQVKTLEQELGKSPDVSSTPSSVPASSQATIPSPVVAPAVGTPASVASQGATPSQPEPTPPELTRSLSRGSSGDDVRKLQEFLSKDKEIYPNGLITGFFGSLTEVAVKKWQEKHGIESVGIVGPKTIAKLQDIGRGVIQGLLQQGAGSSGIVPPGLLKSPAATTPSGTIPAQSIGLTGTTTVSAVPVQQIVATTTTISATTTPSGVIPAIPATPAIPAQPVAGAVSTILATPAVSATPAVTTTASSTATTTAAVAAPIFTITSPNGGEQMTVGNAYTITWTSSGTSVSTVNIDIYKSGSYSAGITYSVSNNGSMSWAVPAAMTAGTDYKIRVYNNAYSNNFDESDSTFSILVPTTAPSSPPIGYWKFDGNGNNEIAGNPSAVTVGNATFKTSGGKFSGYLYMPANNDYAKIPYNSMFNLQNFTVEFWFRQRSNQSFNQNLIYKGTPTNNYNFNIFRYLWNQYNNGTVIAGSTAAGTGYWHQVSNPNEPPHNAWHHVVYTKTTEGGAYYIDGALIHSRNYVTDNSPEYAGPVKTPAVDIIIGNPAPDTDIDNLRIYNYSLSRGEVLYNLENIPSSATAAADTTPPSISSVQTTNLTSTGVAITWTTSEAADSRVDYGLNTSYGSMVPSTGYDNIYVSSHSITLSGLQPGTLYHYQVKSRDAALNLGYSADYTLTTAAASIPLPAPTYIRPDWYTSWPDYRDNKVGQQMIFQYPGDSGLKTTIFRFYQKRPADSSFSLVGEFSGFDSTSCTANGARVYVGEWGLIGAPWTSCQYWAITRNPVSASSYAVGEYSYYVAAVDSAGKEGVPSATAKQIFFEPITILAPTASQSPVSQVPTFQWIVGNGWPPNVSGQAPLLFTIAIFDSLTASNPFWSTNINGVSSPGTNSKAYSGPALDPTKKYRLTIHGWGSQSSAGSVGPSYMALPNAVTDFWIATTSAAVTLREKALSSLDLRARNLAVISKALNEINEKLLKLLQGL